MTGAVLVRVERGIACVTLSNPAARNALTLSMVDDVETIFDDLESRSDVSSVVVTGADHAFCSGATVGLLEPGDFALYRRLYQGFLRIRRCPLPTVAAIDGAAVGAGVNLALCCDVRLVSPRARIISRFLEIGLHPGGGHMWMLEHAIGAQQARALALFGEELRGADAVTVGFALRCVPAEKLLDEAQTMAMRVAKVPRDLLERAKQTFAAQEEISSHGVALEREAEAQEWSVKRRQSPTASSTTEGAEYE